MRKALLAFAVIGVLVASGAGCLAQAPADGLIPPPPIFLPDGSRIVTELNLSDSDVLGIIKQLIPAVGDMVKEIVQARSAVAQPGVPDTAAKAAVAESLDFEALSAAIAGIRNVRFLAAHYDREVDPATLMAQLESGVAKAGKFSKLASDFAFAPGGMALYAQPDNAGYMGFRYDEQAKMLYAVRIVGSVDIAGLAQWGAKMVGLLTVRAVPVENVPTQPTRAIAGE